MNSRANPQALRQAQSPVNRLFLGIGWLGSLSVLSGGVVLAQTPVLTTPPAPVAVETAPSIASPPPEVAPEMAPEPFAPEFSQPIQVPLPGPNPAAQDSYTAPSTIVLSERSTGCQAVISTGQAVPGGICAPKPEAISPRGNLTAIGVTPLGSGSAGYSTTSLKDYYYRTVRPPARLGNGNIRLVFPLSIPAAISSVFGWRVHPVTGSQRFHSGTDLAAPLGTPVLAAYAGRVAIADFLGGYGLTVTVDHNKGTQQTLYAHLSEIFVKPGEWVNQGTVIGRVGSTGLSTGPHLHFEFRQLTPEGWVALDAGTQLEYALAELARAMQVAAAKGKQPVGG